MSCECGSHDRDVEDEAIERVCKNGVHIVSRKDVVGASKVDETSGSDQGLSSVYGFKDRYE